MNRDYCAKSEHFIIDISGACVNTNFIFGIATIMLKMTFSVLCGKNNVLQIKTKGVKILL